MPVPLTIAFWAMSAARRYHSVPTFERPFRLRRVYFARLTAYSLVAITGIASTKLDFMK